MSQTASREELPGGLDAVLISSAASSGRHMHHPHPDDPSRPACGRTLDSANRWRSKDHWRHVIGRPRCGNCPWPDEAGGQWDCLDCDRLFNSKRALRQHQREHCGGDGE